MNINRLNKLIIESKLNKTKLAERCGVSRTTLDNVLAGADAKISTVESLANVLNVSVGCLFDDDIIANKAIANGDSSVAAVNSNVSVGENETILQERVKNLEALLAEKERLINVLMGGR